MKRSHNDICRMVSQRLEEVKNRRQSRQSRQSRSTGSSCFDVLQLPSDLWLHCLAFLVATYLDALVISQVCRKWQRIVQLTPGIFEDPVVHVTQNNANAILAVHPYWEKITGIFNFQWLAFTRIRDVRLIDFCDNDSLLEIAKLTNLKSLVINACNVSGLVLSLPHMQRLQNLCVPHKICSHLAPVLPLALQYLTAHGITASGAQNLPILHHLTEITLKSYCRDAITLSTKIPSLHFYEIGPALLQSSNYLLDFVAFSKLVGLTLLSHGTYTVPMSLNCLQTFQSNELQGALPTQLRSLTLFQRDEFPLNTHQVDELCSLPSLEDFTGDHIQSSTLRRLSVLPNFVELSTLSAIEELHRFPFIQLRRLTISDCSSPLFFYQLSSLALQVLTIFDSTVSHVVIHKLLKMLTTLRELYLEDCPNVSVKILRFRFPHVQVN